MFRKTQTHHERVERTDADLTAPNQIQIQGLVKNLAEESLSMAWRSNLNERLRSEAASRQKRVRQRWFVFGSSSGLGLVCTILFVVFFSTRVPQTVTPELTGSLESQIAGLHQESRVLSSVSGTGVNYQANKTAPVLPNEPEQFDDLEFL